MHLNFINHAQFIYFFVGHVQNKKCIQGPAGVGYSSAGAKHWILSCTPSRSWWDLSPARRLWSVPASPLSKLWTQPWSWWLLQMNFRFFCSVLYLILSDPVQEKNVLQSWLYSVYVAKLLNILPCLARKPR